MSLRDGTDIMRGPVQISQAYASGVFAGSVGDLEKSRLIFAAVAGGGLGSSCSGACRPHGHGPVREVSIPCREVARNVRLHPPALRAPRVWTLGDFREGMGKVRGPVGKSMLADRLVGRPALVGRRRLQQTDQGRRPTSRRTSRCTRTRGGGRVDPRRRHGRAARGRSLLRPAIGVPSDTGR
jgi:hypothetical protein